MMTEQSLAADLDRAKNRSRLFDNSTPDIVLTLELGNIARLNAQLEAEQSKAA